MAASLSGFDRPHIHHDLSLIQQPKASMLATGERPTKFELIINLKTAKRIGLTIPPEVLTRANRLVK